MQVGRVIVGPVSTNCYVVLDENAAEGIIIDPGAEPESVVKMAHEMLRRSGKPGSLEVFRYIFNTHGHFDHISACESIRSLTGGRLFIHELDALMLSDAILNGSALFGYPVNSIRADEILRGGEKFEFGGDVIEVIHTPGHTPGSVSLKLGDIVFTGDTLFCESVGRTDLPGGSFEVLRNSILSELFKLPGNTKVYPGHGPETTIEHEKRHNPFVNSGSMEMEL